MASSPATDTLSRLRADLEVATGHDPSLDARIGRLLGGDVDADYSASVPRCTELIGRRLPGWRWHVGYGASGVFPYASLSRGDDLRTASAPTVPLALLAAMVETLLLETDGSVSPASSS